MAAGDHTRNRVGNCSIDRERWPCRAIQLDEATEALKAAEDLAVLVEEARTALSGSMKEWGLALFAMFAGLDEYRRASGQTAGPADKAV